MKLIQAVAAALFLQFAGGPCMAQVQWSDESLIVNRDEKMGKITVKSHLNARIPMKSPAPASMQWNVTMELKDGRAAGVFLWADQKANEAFAVYLNDRHDRIFLSRVGKWPDEQRLAEFPRRISDGRKVYLRIVAANGIIRVYDDSPEADENASKKFPILEARGLVPAGNFAGLFLSDSIADFLVGEPVQLETMAKMIPLVPTIGEYEHIYDPGVGEENTWYINDHCFVRGDDGVWHLYGITHEHPANPLDERIFAHATAKSPTQIPWEKQPPALTYSTEAGENHLWAPHVVKKDSLYYMFYCAGSLDSSWAYRIHLATSKDLVTWTRHAKNPLFMDYYDARDPMVNKINNVYYMYYTVNMDARESNHAVAVRFSEDLLNWSPARIVFISPAKGTFGGPTESPFVVQLEGYFYLFLGPADGEYHKTAVYRSSTPLYFSEANRIAEFPSHAAEVIRDGDQWYLSDSGWDLKGVRLAPMTWRAEASN